MQLLMMLLLPLFNLVYSGSGYPPLHINLSPSMQPSRPLPTRKISEELGQSSLHIPAVIQAIQGRMLPSNLEFPLPNALQLWRVEHSFGPSSSPAPSPTYRGPVSSPSSSQSLRPHRHRHHQHHYHHRERPIAVSPSPSTVSGCDEITCTEPFTSTPFGSPCGCVLPMKVELRLGISPYEFFPLVVELEIEVAASTYLKQNQVKIMGASVDVQDQGKTVVDINLVPLGEKFDSTTAALNNDRFWQKKVHINATLFGDYDVIYIRYPGLPSSPPLEDSHGPVGSGDHKNPVVADIHGKNQKMNARTIGIIAFSACVLFLVCLGMVSILLKCKKVGRTSATSGPAVTSSIIKRPGTKSNLSGSMVSSASVSLVSTMATLLLSVETFTLPDLEKATEKFSSKRILGRGGFGCVYHGNMEDGTEVAIKLLTSGSQNGDHEFIGEIQVLSRLHHRNLVKLIGICIEEHTRCLVYELVPNGSVESHLHGIDKIKGPLDWDARLKIALGAARGLAYLHEDSNPRVIHRDFKASNILLEDDFTPKVSDFGMAREATEGNQHISTRVMGTFGYVAPEYAMTGHLLVKSDVYSYGVVLLELLSGRKPVDMSQPPGQENLVTWARSLLTSREGLEQLVDPSLHGNYDFNDMAKVAAIASICVHPEVAQRPFMGEVVQALKLIYNDLDETCVDCCSLKESSDAECEFKGDPGPSDSNWWNAGGITPHLKYGYASSFVTMEHSSGSLEGIENRPLSTSSFIGEGGPLSMRHSNRSGPLRTVRSKLAFYRLRGSISEHGGLLSRRVWSDGSWV